MKRNLLGTPISLLAFALVLGAGIVPSMAADTERTVEKVSGSPFQATVQQLEAAVKANRLMIVGQMNHQNMLTMMNMKIKGSQTFEVFHPQYGKILFENEPAAGIAIPLRLYVYERADGKTIVTYYMPSAAFAPFKHPELDKLGKTLDGILQTIVEAATR
ncbi:MAG: DUF302 domain-containing protein [Nitrospirae bacterium]|nr:DUF302 domain-containing protein [Nitrospirota bacterium]